MSDLADRGGHFESTLSQYCTPLPISVCPGAESGSGSTLDSCHSADCGESDYRHIGIVLCAPRRSLEVLDHAISRAGPGFVSMGVAGLAAPGKGGWKQNLKYSITCKTP